MDTREHRLVPLAGKAEESDLHRPEVLTAGEAAELLRVARKFVYAHAPALGGWRVLGDRGPWRFSRRELLARQQQGGRAPLRPTRARNAPNSRERTHTPAGVPILPSEPRREAR